MFALRFPHRRKSEVAPNAVGSGVGDKLLKRHNAAGQHPSAVAWEPQDNAAFEETYKREC